MPTPAIAPGKWRKRIWTLTITGTVIGISFAIVVAVMALVVLRLLLVAVGIIGMATAGLQGATNALQTGDSATRMAVLTQLKKSVDAQPAMTFDSQTSSLILPAIEQCKTDVDPEVVSLAEELAISVKDRTQPPPQ